MSSNASPNATSMATTVPDPHGHAAMLLVESLLHGLIARNVITVSEAVEIVDTATEISVDIARDGGRDPVDVRQSIGLLESISTSLSRDLPR